MSQKRRDASRGRARPSRHKARGKEGRGQRASARNAEVTAPSTDPGRLAFRPANYAAFLLGAVAIVAGYVSLDRGSVTAAPILLTVGYAVLLPLGLILGWRRLGGR